MTAEQIARLMAAPDAPEPLPYGPNTAAVQRVLIELRERVAQAACEATLELRRLGVDERHVTRR